MSNRQMSFQLVRVKCVDETGGFFGERAGNDEISLAGFGIDATGKVVKLDPFEVYPHFDDGDVKNYSPPQTILTLDVPNTGTFPKTCGVGLILAETDGGGLSEAAQKAFEEATKKQQQIGNGVIIVESPLPPWYWDEIRDKVANLISLGWKDEIFRLQGVSVAIPSPDAKLSSDGTVEFRGHDGKYLVTYRFLME